MKRMLRKQPEGEPAACAFCGFAAIKGLDTSMGKPLPNGDRAHRNRKVCDALRRDESLRKEVIELYGQPRAIPDSIPAS